MWERPVVLYPGGFADKHPAVPEFTGEDLVEFLTSFPDPACDVASCPGRDCPEKARAVCWAPSEIADGETRADEAVIQLNYLVLDLDHIGEERLEEARASLADLEHVLHTTHSHAPPDGSWRLILSLDRPMSPEEFPLVWRAVLTAYDLPVDEVCHNPSRLYAAPTARGGVPPRFHHRRGEPLRVDECLEAARQLGLGQPPRPAPGGAPPAPEALDLGELRKTLSDARRSKAVSKDERLQAQAELLGRVLDGRPLAAPGERDDTVHRTAGLLAYWLPPRCPWEAALQVMRPSLAAMDCAPEGLGHWEEVARAKYERQMQGRLRVDEEREAARAAARALADRFKQKAAPSPEDLGDRWTELLQMSKGGRPAGNEHNARLLLACAPDLRGTIKWNQMTKRVEVHGGPLGGLDENVLPAAAAGWLQGKYEFQGGARLMGPALMQVALDNAYDPLADYLGELAWDGKPRLDAMLETYFGVRPKTERQARYVRAVSRRWLLSLVARALRPGCKADCVLILEGPQGVGKSTGLEAVVGERWFLDTALALGSKDAMLALSSAWLVELAELASFRRAESQAVKQFVSAKVDKYRPPYGHATVDSPRRCVIAGTHNPDGNPYLPDRTGNRRYWPVLCEARVDVAGIARDRDQLMAEAVAAFAAGERWHFDPALDADAVAAAAEEAADRAETSTVDEAVAAWWYGLAPGRRPAAVSVLDVARDALQTSVDRVDSKLQAAVGRAMKDMGFSRAQRMSGGVRRWVYVATKELQDAPQERSASRDRHLALVQAVKEKGK